MKPVYCGVHIFSQSVIKTVFPEPICRYHVTSLVEGSSFNKVLSLEKTSAVGLSVFQFHLF